MKTGSKLLASLKTMPRFVLLFTMLSAIAGCQTDQFEELPSLPPSQQASELSKQIQLQVLMQHQPNIPQQAAESSKQTQPGPLILKEGDVLNISFPGSSSLDTSQQIRTDGKIVLPLIGEVTAAGKTPDDLQSELLKLYQPQVATKQIIVTVQSFTFTVYVVGAVLRPGTVTVDHPLSALEAIMEAGGFDYTKANPRTVVVVRQLKDRTVRYRLNLKKALAGSQGGPFLLEPFDIIYVPERFTWF
jgi:polysaccharide biosynthesis/export protein